MSQSAQCFSRIDLVAMGALHRFGLATIGDVTWSFHNVLRRFMV